MGHQGQAFGQRLGDEHSIEGVRVVDGKPRQALGVFEGDRKLVESASLDERREGILQTCVSRSRLTACRRP